jgi:diguanylate cyclase (GGDEF)-like protein
VAIIGLDDPRMFTILPQAKSAAGAAMLPLYDGNRLVGSYHIALTEIIGDYAEPERELFAMLAQLFASALLRVVEYQRVDELTLLDPITEMGNLRAFRRDMLREIYWARRVDEPLSLLSIALDDLEDLSRSYGEVTCHFVQRRVSQRLCSDLRATDYIARVSDTHFAVLLPSCSEPHAHDIAERMRHDIDDFAIDDGRGAVLYVSLSIGLVCWEPARHPVESSERLSSQMESEAHTAMQKAERAGGNRVSVARIGLLML